MRSLVFERLVAVALSALLAACSPGSEGPPAKARAGAPLDPARAAREMAAARDAALRGDSDGVRRAHEALGKDVLRSMRAPDPTRPIDPERARAVVRALPDVRSVIWLDGGHLLVSVASSAARSMTKIDEVCAALDPLGDTLAVEVHLQNVVAMTGDEAQTLSRNCQLEPGMHALMTRERKVDVLDQKLRDEFRSMQAQPTQGDTPHAPR